MSQTQSPARLTDRPELAVTLMLGFCMTIPFADAMSKLIGERVPTSVFLLARFGFQALIFTPLALYAGQSLRIGWRGLRLSFWRGACHIAGLGGIYLSFRVMPLADAIAICFVMPFILLALGHFVLGEQVGWRRTTAAAVGFVGTLMVIQPSFAAVGAAAFLPLLTAFVFALFMLLTRQLVQEAGPFAVQAVSGWASVAIVAVLFLVGHAGGIADLSLATPSTSDALLLIGIGLLGNLSHLLMTTALRYAPSATLAPMQYVEIPVATFVGWLFFREFPNGVALAGIAITMAAGLYVIFREHALSREAARQSRAQAPNAAE